MINNQYNMSSVMAGLLGRARKNFADIADVTGIDAEQIYRWRCGKEHNVTPMELIRLARAFSPKGQELVDTHAALLLAHLKDLCVGPGSKLICLERTDSPDWLITASFGRVYITPGVRNDLIIIHNNIWRDINVRRLVRSVAKYCRLNGLK